MTNATGNEWWDVDTEGNLLVKNVNHKMSGTYNCVAKNEYDESMQDFILKVTGTYDSQ